MELSHFWVPVLLTIIGLLAALRLARYTLTVASGPCLFFPPTWCFQGYKDKFRWTFGIPNAFLGVIFYVLLLGSFVAGTEQVSAMHAIQRVLASVGFVMSVYFLYIQWKVLQEFCLWCTVSGVVLTAIFILVVL